jgi:hypothetical protein
MPRRSPWWWRATRQLARAGWWVVARVAGPAVVVTAWCVYVWCSGRSWSHRPRRRWVRREVRAAGNWALTAAVAAVAWRPVVVASLLAAIGGSLVVTALVSRRQPLVWPNRQPPVRVSATVGTPHQLSTGRR